MKRQKTHAGRYYGLTKRGELEPIAEGPVAPDDLVICVICRRVSDFPTVPAGAKFALCAICGTEVAFNPAGPHQTHPKVCLQCAAIEPLPIH